VKMLLKVKVTALDLYQFDCCHIDICLQFTCTVCSNYLSMLYVDRLKERVIVLYGIQLLCTHYCIIESH